MRWTLLYLLLFFSGAEIASRAWTATFGTPVDKVLGLLRPDAKLGWKARANLDEVSFGARVTTDDQGNRSSRALVRDGAEQAGQLWTFGPSSAFGWGVNAEETYTSLLAARNSLAPTNFSQIGHSSLQGIFALREQKIEPGTVVLFAYGINDLDHFRFFFPSAQSDADFFSAPIPPIALRIAQWGSGWHSFRYLTRFASLIKGKISCQIPARLPRRVSNEEFLANLSAFVKLTKEANAIPVLIDTPYWPVSDEVKEVPSEETYSRATMAASAGNCQEARTLFAEFMALETPRIIRDQRSLNEVMGKWAMSKGLPILKSSVLLSGKNDFIDPIHPSAQGHRKIFLGLTELLKAAK